MRLPDRVHRDADGDGVPDQDAVPAVLHGVGHLHLDRVVRERDWDCECEAYRDLMGCYLVGRGSGGGPVEVGGLRSVLVGVITNGTLGW